MRALKKAALATTAAATLALGGASAAVAQPNQVAEAAGLVAVVVQVDRTLNDVQVLSDIGEINIIRVEDSLNNLQVLNNSPILSDNVVTVQNFLNNCTVLSCIELRNFLNNNNVNITDVIAIDVLSGGDINVFVGQ